MSLSARDASHSNIFKAMKDITFEQTISHQCGVTMNDTVEARAIAEFMGKKPGVTVTYQPALIRIDGDGQAGCSRWTRSAKYLGREMTAETFEVNTSTHYGRMVRGRRQHRDPVRQHGRDVRNTSNSRRKDPARAPGAGGAEIRSNAECDAGEQRHVQDTEGKEIFVVDGHTHFWDGSPENQKNIHGKQFIECFYAYHTNLSPKRAAVGRRASSRNTTPKTIYRRPVHRWARRHGDSPVDLSQGFLQERLQHDRTQRRGEAKRYPERFIVNGAFDPRDGEKALEYIHCDCKENYTSRA